MPKCEEHGCDNEAVANVFWAHPDPAMRWTADLCQEHLPQAPSHTIGGTPVFGPAGEKGKIHCEETE